MIEGYPKIREAEARRALVLDDRPLVVDLIQMTLNHGLFVVRAASSMAEADGILADWQPHMAVIDARPLDRDLPSRVRYPPPDCRTIKLGERW